VEGLNNLLNVGADGLDKLFAKLSEVLGVGIDLIQQNAIKYILEYGKYSLIESIINTFIGGLIISIMIAGVTMLIYYSIDDECMKFKSACVEFFILMSVPILLILGRIVMYLSSPQIYSIKQIMKLLNN